MSGPPRPGVDRQISTHPALREDVTRVPVTPGVLPDGFSAYNEVKRPDSARSAYTPLSPPWGASPYSNRNAEGRPTSPTEVAAGAKTGEELLRRLSLSGPTTVAKDPVNVDPRVAHDGLNLSGGIITATFCVPYSVGHSPGHDWVNGSEAFSREHLILTSCVGTRISPRDLCPLRLFLLPRFARLAVEPYFGWLDR